MKRFDPNSGGNGDLGFQIAPMIDVVFMTMKKSIMTKTTSIIGAIWKPRLPSLPALGLKRFIAWVQFRFTAEKEMSVMPASAAEFMARETLSALAS